MNARKIIYVTGTRADYGLMREVLKKIHQAPEFDLSICVTGMHLSALYGNTVKEIEQDEFNICGLIPVDVDDTTPLVMSQSIGHELLGMSEIFAQEKPALLILLGDRGEMLAAAIAAVHLNIPIVHFHGGERSGTVDEMIRHAISKLAHYHFVATASSAERLLIMCEKKENIHVVGAPGLEQFCHHKAIDKVLFNKKYHLNAQQKIALVVYHPVVQEYDEIKSQFNNVLAALLAAGFQMICLEPNSDAGGQIIRCELAAYKEHQQIRVIKHLQRTEFIDCLANVDVMVGNSSSGIIEAASFNLAVVNIGTRQNLRDCSTNVIHVDTTFESIMAGLHDVMSQAKQEHRNIYGDGNTSELCYQLLQSLDLNPHILNKCNEY